MEPSGHQWCIGLLGGLSLTYATETVSYAHHAITRKLWHGDAMIYSLVAALVWGLFTLLLSDKRLSQLSCLCTCMLSMMSEITLGVIRISSLSVCLYVSRMILLAALAGFVVYLLLTIPPCQDRKGKSQSCRSKPDCKQAQNTTGQAPGMYDVLAFLREVSISRVHVLGMVLFFILEGALSDLLLKQYGILVDNLTDHSLSKELSKWCFYKLLDSPIFLRFWRRYFEESVLHHAEVSLSTRAFQNVMVLSADYHQNKSTNERSEAVRLSKHIPSMVRQCLVATLHIVKASSSIQYLVRFDSYVALAAISVWAITCWSNFAFLFLLSHRQTAQGDAGRKETKLLHDLLLNWSLVMHYGKVDIEKHRYRNAVVERLRCCRLWTETCQYNNCAGFLPEKGIFLSMVVLVVLKVSNGKATPGDFTIVLMHGTRLWDSLDMVKHSFRAISQRLAGARLETFSATPTVADQPGAAPLRITEGSICFSNVSFKHGEKSILRRISATVSGGQTVGLVGETGAGKSTLLRLLAREFDVQGGSIHIDGQDIREATLQSLRNAIGILQQKPELLNRTIRENVSYGLTDTTTGTEIADKVEEACQAACIHRSIVHFVHGYDTMVGEQGINLSGGQRQQIAIARLMLTDPRVVLLDEPTSALDPKTEREIMHGPFGDWIANRTTFIVAHQLVTVKSADLILVMKHGQIVESGTHTQLIKNGRFYSELWNR